jgi:hypothetical protein
LRLCPFYFWIAFYFCSGCLFLPFLNSFLFLWRLCLSLFSPFVFVEAVFLFFLLISFFIFYFLRLCLSIFFDFLWFWCLFLWRLCLSFLIFLRLQNNVCKIQFYILSVKILQHINLNSLMGCTLMVANFLEGRQKGCKESFAYYLVHLCNT